MEGTQPHPSTENWIKDLLNMVLPIRTRHNFPHSQSLPLGNFYNHLIHIPQSSDRMKTTITESLFRSHCSLLFLFPLHLEVSQRGSFCGLCQRLYFLCFPLRVLQFLALHLSLWSIFSLYLCMVLGNVLVSFFFLILFYF